MAITNAAQVARIGKGERVARTCSPPQGEDEKKARQASEAGIEKGRGEMA